MKNSLLSSEAESLSRRATFIVLGAWLVLVLLSFSRHEMWRDEVEPWAFCLQHDFGDIVSVPTLTGHPPVWYYIVETTTLLGSHPHLMRIPHTIFMLIALWLLLRYAPFKKLDKILLVFGYYFLYEYAVLTRNYALSLLLLLAIASLWPRRQECFWWIVLLSTAAIFTMILNGLIIVFFLLLLWLEVWQCRHEKKTPAIKPVWLMIGSFILAAVMLGVVIWSTPRSGSYFSPMVKLKTFDLPAALYALKSAANAFLPLSKFSIQFWNNHLIEHGAVQILVSLMLLIASVFTFRRKPGFMVVYFSAASLLLLFFFKVYGGSWRHHGYLWILFIIACWLYPEWSASRPRPDGAPDGRDRYYCAFFRGLCWLHAVAVLIPLYYDWHYDFSAGKAAAEFLQPQLAEKSVVMCDVDFSGMALAAYLQRPVYFPGLQDTTIWVSYDSPKRDRQAFKRIHNTCYHAMIWAKAVELATTRRQSVWLVANYRIDKPLARDLRKTIVPDEKHYIYRVGPEL